MVFKPSITSILLFFCLTCAKAKDCTISMSNDFSTAEPVLLTSNDGLGYDLFNPEGQITTITEGTKFQALCSGSGNLLRNHNSKTLDFQCRNGVFQTTDGRTLSIKELQCSFIPEAQILTTQQTCANNHGQILKSGFAHHSNQFATTFVICYNTQHQKLEYSHNIINGPAIKSAIYGKERVQFRADGMSKSTAAVNYYFLVRNQISRFNNIFGTHQHYVNNNNFFSRGHCAPDGDFLFRYEQLSTYFYVNVNPQTQVTNSGNWLTVEKTARNLAARLDNYLYAYTSVLGNLELPDANNNYVRVYMDERNEVPVPSHYIKILHDPKNDAAIAFVTSNNPYAINDDSLQICRNVCAKANIKSVDFEKPELGYTTCCELSEIKQFLPNIPVTANNLLSWPRYSNNRNHGY